MSALKLSEIDERQVGTWTASLRRDEASPYTVSILCKGLVVQTLVKDLDEAHEIIDRAEAAGRCKFAAIVDRNGRHVPRRSANGGLIEEHDEFWGWYADLAPSDLRESVDPQDADGLNGEATQPQDSSTCCEGD